MDTIKSKIIEPFRIVGNWNVQSKKLMEKFSQLTDADLKFDRVRKWIYLPEKHD